MIRLAASIVIGVALLYLGIGTVLFFFQRSLIFMNDKTDVLPAAIGLPDVEVHRLTAKDGIQLVAWLARAKSDRLIVYFHGNGGSLASRGERIKQLTDLDLSVLAIDYRGFGGSAGSPSETGLHADADVAYDFARRLGYQPGQIFLYGESLGTGVAVALAARHQVAGVILDSAFSSIADVAADRYWMFPVRPLLKDPFNSEALIDQISAPILMLHGTDDEVVPIRFGHRLFARAGTNATFETLTDDDHLVFGNPDAKRLVQSWLTKIR